MDTIESKIGERKQFLLDNNLEKLQEEFLSKKECRDFIKAIKFYKIPLQLYHANYNCKYMDLPFQKKGGQKMGMYDHLNNITRALQENQGREAVGKL